MGVVGFYLEKVDSLRKLPRGKFLKWAYGKALGSLALGLLLATYVKNVDWSIIGWVLLGLAFVLALPSLIEIYSKKQGPAAE